MLLFTLSKLVNGQDTITKNIGQLYFYDETKTLNYKLNLEAYFENEQTFENNTKRLEKLCTELPDNTQCLTYLQTFKYDQKIMKENAELIRSYTKSRTKRWAAMIPRFFGLWGTRVFILSAVTSAGVSYAYNGAIQNKQGEYNEVLEASVNNTYKELLNEKAERLDTKMRETKHYEYEDVIHSTIILANKHFRDTNIFMNVFGDNIRTYFFSIIPTENFKDQLDGIKKELPPDYTIPDVTIFEMIEISKITVTKDQTSIQINVDIPIFLNKNITLFELIPIPTLSGNIATILNYNSLHYFIINNEIKIMPFRDFEDCIKLENLTICNTIVFHSIEQPDSCLRAIITNKTLNHCQTNKIPYKNYIMETSIHSAFCYIVKPIILRIACNGRNFIHKLNTSSEIIYDTKCDVYEVTNKVMSNTTDIKTIEINFSYFKPNFSYYDKTLQNWTYDITQINKREIKLLETIEDTRRLIEKIQEAKKINSTNIFKPIADFFNEFSMTKWLVKMFLTYCLLPLIILKLVLCFCTRLKRLSYSE